MNITMVDFTENPELKIAEYAGICYDADTSPDRNEKRVQSIMKQRHLATLRFAYATFKVEGVSRVCSHQLVRHPHLSFLQRSQRYCKEHEQPVIIPESIAASNTRSVYATAIRMSTRAYEDLIAAGVRKEDARFVLPQGASTELYITGNLQAWHDFLVRRLDKHAQWEARLVATMIYGYLRNVAPNIFNEMSLNVSDAEIYSES